MPSAPALVGLNINKAKGLIMQIKDTRFKLKITWKYDNNIREGVIISQSPSANSSVPVDSTFDLVVSKGLPIVPDLGGASRDEAQEQVADTALVFSAREEYDEDVDEGQVIRQNPPAGTRVAIGTPVEVVISKGGNPFPGDPEVTPVLGEGGRIIKYVCSAPWMGPSCPHADLH